jgi:RND family efflux transporter MFP subunit
VKKLFFLTLIASITIIGCSGEKATESSNRTSGGWGYGSWGAGGTSKATSVETKKVTLQPIAEQVRSFGTIKSQDVVAITPQISNYITKFYADLGDTVDAGQLLVKINDTALRDQLAQAEAQLMQSKIALSRDSSSYYRAKILAQRELSSVADLEIAQATYQSSVAAYKTAKASLTQAQENFNYTEVRSPVRGVILSRIGEEGDVVSSAQPIFEIANLTGYETRVFLPVQDWRFVQIGQLVNLRVSNEAESSAKGIISRKSPQLDATTGLGEIVISLSSVGNSIYPGVLTESVIDIQNKANTIVVPRSALVEKVETVVEPESNTITLDKTYSVFVSIGDTVAELRPLTLGIEQGDKIEIVAGLNPGEDIIITGQSSLKDGGKIRVASGVDFSSPASSTLNNNSGGWGDGTISNSQSDSSNPERNRNRPNFSTEDREKMRERMQSLSPKERRALMDSIRTANSLNN